MGHTEEQTSFGRLVMGRRQSLDMTRDDLADKVGCAPITIAKIERDERRPSRQMAELLADVLKLGDSERPVFIRLARGVIDPENVLVPVNIPTAGPTATETAPTDGGMSLPVSVTSFVGRDNDLAKVRALLWRADVRLLTLTGPPGIGKTRLGLAVATALQDDFKDGVRWVPLAPVSDPNLISSTIARALDVKEQVGHSMEETLRAYLRDKQMLILVDNFEHVLPAARVLSGLLSAAPNVKVLVTSREVLRLYGEHEYQVPPLEIPTTDDRGNYAASKSEIRNLKSEIGAISSVALFVQRAQAVKPDFVLDEQNTKAVGQICRQLDGLPLAIELAAARVKLFSPEAMLARLESSLGSLGVLTGGPRDAPARQQTLRGAIEWSYELLNDAEKRLFRRLSVFRGGRSAEAVAAVCMSEVSDADEALSEALELLEALADKSLIGSGPGVEGEPRFWMLETIFQFASEKLQADGEADTIKRRHSEFYLSYVNAESVKINGPEPALVLARLDQEIDNIRTALTWMRGHGEQVKALEMATYMARYWNMKTQFVEGNSWLHQGIAETPDEPSTSRGRAHYFIGGWLMMQDEPDRAIPYMEEALRIYRAISDRHAIATALNVLAGCAALLGKFSEAHAYFNECLQVMRELGQPVETAALMSNLAFTSICQGEYDKALDFCIEALEIHKDAELKGKGYDATNRILLRINTGLAHMHKGDVQLGITKNEESLAEANRLGTKRSAGIALTYMGLGESLLGNFEKAKENYSESFRLFEEMGQQFGIARNLVGLGRLALATGDARRAVMLCGVAEANYRALNVSLVPLERMVYEEVLREGKERLGEAEFEAARQEGRETPYSLLLQK